MVQIIKILRVVIICNLFLILPGNTAEILLEEIIAGIKYNKSLIKDWKAECYITVRFEDGTVERKKEIWAQKGEKIYREVREDEKVSYIVSFDGELLRIVGDNKKALIKVPSENEINMAFFNPTTSPLSLCDVIKKFENEPMEEFLSEKAKDKKIELVEEIKIGQDKYYLVKATVRKGIALFKYMFYIAPNYGFRPTKIIIETENKYGWANSTIENIYHKYGNIWFLKSSKIKSSLDFEAYSKDYKKSTTIQEVELENIEINKGIPDSFFQIEFPKGTKVYDERTGVTYEVR